MAFFSSNGPTSDGRVGVDVVAPGLFVTAAASNTDCAVTPMAGTSMAAAVMTGVCVCVCVCARCVAGYVHGIHTSPFHVLVIRANIHCIAPTNVVPMYFYSAI
jgi:hypothetical protein